LLLQQRRKLVGAVRVRINLPQTHGHLGDHWVVVRPAPTQR
jgi:hypothetical protein